MDNGVSRSLNKVLHIASFNFEKATEVALHLLDISLMFGAPQILQSDKGSEFTAFVISELKLLWPDLLTFMVNQGIRKVRDQFPSVG